MATRCGHRRCRENDGSYHDPSGKGSRAAKHDVAEVIVTPLSGRPLAAAAAFAPVIGQVMMRLTRVQGAFKHMADQRAAKR